MTRRLLPLALLGAFASVASGADLEEVLTQMDRAADSFSGVRAKVEKEDFTAVLGEKDVERGRMSMRRSDRKGGDVSMKIEFTEPSPRSLAMAGAKAEIFYPKINTVQEYDLGKHRKLVDQFLLLGFGTEGKKLKKDYRINVVGPEEIGSQKATRLALTPKSKKARESFTKVEIWIADPEGYPVRQKFHRVSDDTTTISYQDVEINPGLTDADVALKLPADVKREYPQR